MQMVKHLQVKKNGPRSVPTWNAMDMTARCTSRAPKEKSRPWQNARNLARAQKSARVYLTSRADGAATGARLAKRRGLTRRWLCRSSLPLSRTLSQLVTNLSGPKSVPNWNAMDMTARCTSRAPEEKSRPWQNARNLARAQMGVRVYLTSRADGAVTGARLATRRGGTRRWLCRSSLPLSQTLSQLAKL